MSTCNLTVSRLRELLDYEPNTGIFTWKVARPRVRVGSVAGNLTCFGYMRICVCRKYYQAHRLAWFYVYGHWPRHEIDHINGFKNDNRIENLRDVSSVLNMQNIHKPRKDNSTGLLGVSPYKKWFKAQIRSNGEKLYLGIYKTKEEAHSAYIDAKQRLHPGSNPSHIEAISL